jgi:hypothetical protein
MMKNAPDITSFVARVALLLAKAFVVTGLVLWYMVSTQYLGETRYVYIPFQDWVRPGIGEEYYHDFILPFIWICVFCVVFLLADGILKLRIKKYQERVSSLVFTTVGILLLLVTNVQISNLLFGYIGPIVVIAMNGVMAALSCVALRRFKSRIFREFRGYQSGGI